MPSEAQPACLERDEARRAEDQVVQNLDVQQPSGLDDGARDGHIIGAGRGVA